MRYSRETLERIIKIITKGTPAERMRVCENDIAFFALYYFSEYFTFKTPEFHEQFYEDSMALVRGEKNKALWIGFRESAKTSIAKIFITYLICYKKRRYINYDSYDGQNSEAALYDVAHALQTNRKIIADFGQLYFRDPARKDSTMKRLGKFIAENGVICEAYTTQESPRGRVFGEIRPDFYVLDDIENNKTKESYAITQKIISHVNELITGLGTTGAVLYLGNYITEYGVIQHIKNKLENDPKAIVRNVPVVDKAGRITWPDKYVHTDADAANLNRQIESQSEWKVSLESKRRDFGDAVFETEMMNNPAKSGDYFFDRDKVEVALTKARDPIKTVGGLKIWEEFSSKHSYGLGADTSEGKGLDANADVVMNYSMRPATVVATFEDNRIQPHLFAYEIKRHAEMFGECIAAPESNHTGYATLAELRGIYDYIYQRERKDKVTGELMNEFGWRTTSGTKYDIMGGFKSSFEDGQIAIYDKGLLLEMLHYRKQDLNAMKMEEGMTRHFDKLMAAAIAWEMRKHARPAATERKKIFTAPAFNKEPYRE